MREQNLRHLETWLAPEALQPLPLETIIVGALEDAALEAVSEHLPRLRPLLVQPACSGSEVRCGLSQSIPWSNIDSCAGLRWIEPDVV